MGGGGKAQTIKKNPFYRGGGGAWREGMDILWKKPFLLHRTSVIAVAATG